MPFDAVSSLAAAVGAAPTGGDLGTDAAPTSWVLDVLDHCPCWNEELSGKETSFSMLHRYLEEEPVLSERGEKGVVSAVLILMLVFMMFDKVGPDWVMVTGLVIFMVLNIITISQALAGFANEGIMTVMALFVVAEGISRTGALDYYMGLLLGTPKTIPGAQIRLMVPIAILSAFLNNTPIVVVMIPLTLRWAKKIGVPKQQLLMPLSYATILGGTCTLVGTSTNLVVSGLLKDEYPDEESGTIGLFDLAIFGVPNAMIGIAYMLAFSSILLPLGSSKGTDSGTGSSGAGEHADALLFGARVKPWSPAAGRTYKRSGLGNSGGIFLTNVRRAATGNVHTAVSKDFVISVGDELYFTGLVEMFGEFCEKHGLEIITTENLHAILEGKKGELDDNSAETSGTHLVSLSSIGPSKINGVTTKDVERLRTIRLLSDQIGGREPVDTESNRPARVVVSLDETEQAVLVGVDSQDRPGLLLDISDALSQQGVNLRYSEAKVFGERSLSVWGCEPDRTSTSSRHLDLEEIRELVYALLHSSDHAVVAKKKTTGTQVVRAVVTNSSGLIGKKPIDVEFRKIYSASIVAYQKNGKNSLLDVEIGAGDLLVLETIEGSPLLVKPPSDFYDKVQRSGSRRSQSTPDEDNVYADIERDLGARKVWKDLRVIFDSEQHEHPGVPKGEFLTAFLVTAKSPLVNKSLNDFGYAKLPGVVLISIERARSSDKDADVISPDDPLHVGDVFWYSGSAEAIADLQKLHGLEFYHDELLKEEVPVELTERRLVQAVIAKGSPLVGQNVKDVHFRSVYGGVVIAIQRGSERVHELPAKVKLQTGDVLLVEGGPTFVEKQGSNYRTFALVSEVENSSPPRPRLFLLCAAMIVASLTVAGLEYRSLLITAAIVGVVMVSLGVVTQQEARECMQWDLYVTIASAFGIGNAMKESGVAGEIATFLVDVGKAMNIGDAGIYGAVYIAGNLLSAILTNNAAATLMFPIAMGTVDQTGVDRLKMCYILMLSSSDYITSFGYQTNLMVYGPGEYRNIDYLKFGAPMQILLWLSSTAMVATLSIDDPKWIISWIICAAGLAVITVVRLTGGWFSLRAEKKG